MLPGWRLSTSAKATSAKKSWCNACRLRAGDLDTVTPAQQAFEALAVRAWQGGNAKERWRLMQLAKSGFAGVQVLLTPGHTLTIATK